MANQAVNRIRSGTIDVMESQVEEEMSPGAAARALALLARWAARKARKRARKGGDHGENLLTIDISKS